MKTINYKFSKETIALMKALIGQTLNAVIYEGLPNAAITAYGMVSIMVNDCRYCFSNLLEPIEYINRIEDVAIFRFNEITDSAFTAFLEGRTPTINTINQKIKAIKVLNENQQLYLHDVLEFNIFTVRGIVIELEDGYEISFEKSIWFSEFITVKKGYDLLNSFTSLDEFYEEWSESQYTAKAKRDIIFL